MCTKCGHQSKPPTKVRASGTCTQAAVVQVKQNAVFWMQGCVCCNWLRSSAHTLPAAPQPGPQAAPGPPAAVHVPAPAAAHAVAPRSGSQQAPPPQWVRADQGPRPHLLLLWHLVTGQPAGKRMRAHPQYVRHVPRRNDCAVTTCAVDLLWSSAPYTVCLILCKLHTKQYLVLNIRFIIMTL